MLDVQISQLMKFAGAYCQKLNVEVFIAESLMLASFESAVKLILQKTTRVFYVLPPDDAIYMSC